MGWTTWAIKGEATKTLDATVRSCQTLKIEDIILRTATLDDDRMTWTAKTADIEAAATILPDVGQVVELWDGSTRLFRGHAGKRKPKLWGAVVGVEGPWWWLKREFLTSTQSDADGGSAERASWKFSGSTLGAHIASVIALAVARGCPVRAGTIDTLFAFGQMTLSNMSLADAIAELLRPVADAEAWWDYSDTTGNGYPKFNVTRRASMLASPKTYAVGTAPLKDIDIEPQTELQTNQVALHYVQRNPTTGRQQFKTQSAGTNATGRRQIIEVSGPVTWKTLLPQDDFDSYVVRTMAADTFNSNYRYNILPMIAAVQSSRATHGGLPTSTDISLGTGNTLSYYSTSSASGNPTRNFVMAGVKYLLPDDNNSELLPSGQHMLLTGTPPDWVVENYPSLGAVEVKVTGTLYYKYSDKQYTLPYGASNYSTLPDPPTWVSDFPWSRSIDAGFTSDNKHQFVFVHAFEFTAYLIAVAYSSATTIYKPWEYDFLQPPAGLAENLRVAASWLPWTGPITLQGNAAAPTGNMLPYVYRVTGHDAGAATMDAMAKAVEHSLAERRTRIDLGPPARYSYASLVQRVRRDPSDNIYWL